MRARSTTSSGKLALGKRAAGSSASVGPGSGSELQAPSSSVPSPSVAKPSLSRYGLMASSPRSPVGRGGQFAGGFGLSSPAVVVDVLAGQWPTGRPDVALVD